MNKMRSLTEALISQVSKMNPIIKITDFYPMESVFFIWKNWMLRAFHNFYRMIKRIVLG